MHTAEWLSATAVSLLLFCCVSAGVSAAANFSKDKGQIYTFLNAMLNQYDNEDFDLGIKQFMIEQVRSVIEDTLIRVKSSRGDQGCGEGCLLTGGCDSHVMLVGASSRS
jgi:ATP-dependent helicase YprA (DUF1998 family)